MQSKLSLIQPFDARRRGFKRSVCHGIDVAIGRCRASADVWETGAGQTLVRFNAGRHSAYLELLTNEQRTGKLTREEIENSLHEKLAFWALDACDPDE